MMLFDNIPEQKPPVKALPEPAYIPDELDEAIDTLAMPSLEQIIPRVISQEAGELLRKLRRCGELKQKDIGGPFDELVRRRCLYFESRESPIRIGLSEKHIYALAAETGNRVREH